MLRFVIGSICRLLLWPFKKQCPKCGWKTMVDTFSVTGSLKVAYTCSNCDAQLLRETDGTWMARDSSSDEWEELDV